MRGSALRGPGGAVPLASPRGLAGASGPVHPGQEVGLAPSLDHPARRVRPFGIRAQGALLPEAPVRNRGTAPLPPNPRLRNAAQ